MGRWTVIAAVGLLSLGALAYDQGVSPLGIEPVPTPSLSVSVWPERPQYTVGETARVYFYVSRPAYVYIFNVDAAGRVRQLFPNAYSPNPYVNAGTHALPDRPSYQLRVTEPAGTEALQIVASQYPLAVSTGDSGDPFPLLGPTPEAGRARLLGLVPEPTCGCYATAWARLEVLPAAGYGAWPCPPCWGIGPCPPCWGGEPVRPGAGWFCDRDGHWSFFVGDCPPGTGWCWYLGADGRWHMKFRICVGNCD
ncbi:MAG: DUF4384 domain-containing protein [Candidatus Bipolaricaulaceae bacterium]